MQQSLSLHCYVLYLSKRLGHQTANCVTPNQERLPSSHSRVRRTSPFDDLDRIDRAALRVAPMQYITHHFAHPETLQLARRWLVQLGFDPCQIETHTDGIPRIAIAVEPNRVAEAEMVINAAEQTDPDAWPSFWDMARQEHVYPAMTVAHDAPDAASAAPADRWLAPPGRCGRRRRQADRGLARRDEIRLRPRPGPSRVRRPGPTGSARSVGRSPRATARPARGGAVRAALR